jgi:hypothetical protein
MEPEWNLHRRYRRFNKRALYLASCSVPQNDDVKLDLDIVDEALKSDSVNPEKKLQQQPSLLVPSKLG